MKNYRSGFAIVSWSCYTTLSGSVLVLGVFMNICKNSDLGYTSNYQIEKLKIRVFSSASHDICNI